MWSGLGLLLLVVFICEWLCCAATTAAPTTSMNLSEHLGCCCATYAYWLYIAGVAAAELIQDLETSVGAFFLTYFSAGLFALWIPVVFCRARFARTCATSSRQHYELLPQGEDGADAADSAGERESEEEIEDSSSFMQAGLSSAKGAGCAQMLRLGLLFGPLWFFANWTYNASLELTSVRRTASISPLATLWDDFMAMAEAARTTNLLYR